MADHLKYDPLTGHLLRMNATGHLIYDCTGGGGGEDPAPCTLPGGLAGSYTVSPTAIDPVNFEGCGEGGEGFVAPGTLASPAWDGTVSGGSGIWLYEDPLVLDANLFEYGTVYLEYSNGASHTNPLTSEFFACGWVLVIPCQGGWDGTNHTWLGFKSTGATPVGTYSRVAGVDLTSSRSVS